MTTRATWLLEVLTAAGCRVIPVEGWERRGRDVAGWSAVVCHHTATGPHAADSAVVRLLRDGRSDLAGPLSQLGLDRHDRFHLIAAGRCNHNGRGTHGNNALGIEAFNDGVGEPWPVVQVNAYVRGCAAIVDHLGLPTGRVLGHRETDPTRKSDPAGIDMHRFRARVEAHRHEEDDMFEDADRKMMTDLHKEVTAWGEGGLRWMLGRVHHVITTDPSSLAQAIKDEVGPDVVRQIIEELRK